MVLDFLKDDKNFPIYSLSAVKPKIKYVTGSSLFSLLIKLFRIYEQQIFCQTERGYFCLFFSFLNAIFFHMLIFPVVMFVYFTLIMGGIRCFSSRRRTWNFKDLRHQRHRTLHFMLRVWFYFLVTLTMTPTEY